MYLSKFFKLEKLINLFNNLISRKNLVIFIGRFGITLLSLKYQKIYRHKFFSFEQENYLAKVTNYLKQYKSYHLQFLLDNPEAKLTHEVIPTMGAILKNNPVAKFIEENYAPEDIVAYNIYQISNKNTGEAWHSCLMSTAFVTPVSNLLEYVIKNFGKYSGTYFLNLEFLNIIDHIVDQAKLDYHYHLQIFVTITEASGIKIITKYRSNVLDEQIIPYPVNKSLAYVQGVIEQAITDKLLFYQEYRQKLQTDFCVITFTSSQLKPFMHSMFFEQCTVKALSPADLDFDDDAQTYLDHYLLKICTKYSSYLAYNKPLNTINTLSLINNIIFKPLAILASILIIYLIYIKHQSFTLAQKIDQSNNQYYQLAENYRQIKKRHPNYSHIGDLIDLYNLQNILQQQTISPLQDLKLLISTDHANLSIQNIHWQLIKPNIINLTNNQLAINLGLKFEGPMLERKNAYRYFSAYQQKLAKHFGDDQMAYTKPYQARGLFINKNFVVPYQITIKHHNIDK